MSDHRTIWYLDRTNDFIFFNSQFFRSSSFRDFILRESIFRHSLALDLKLNSKLNAALDSLNVMIKQELTSSYNCVYYLTEIVFREILEVARSGPFIMSESSQLRLKCNINEYIHSNSALKNWNTYFIPLIWFFWFHIKRNLSTSLINQK